MGIIIQSVVLGIIPINGNGAVVVIDRTVKIAYGCLEETIHRTIVIGDIRGSKIMGQVA